MDAAVIVQIFYIFVPPLRRVIAIIFFAIFRPLVVGLFRESWGVVSNYPARFPAPVFKKQQKPRPILRSRFYWLPCLVSGHAPSPVSHGRPPSQSWSPQVGHCSNSTGVMTFPYCLAMRLNPKIAINASAACRFILWLRCKESMQF